MTDNGGPELAPAPTDDHRAGADDLRLLGPHRRRLTVGVVLVITFFAVEAMGVATALPVVERHLGDVWLYGWTFSAFMLATLVGSVMGGAAVDRLGPGRPLALAMALFAAGLVVCGAAPSMPVLVLGRAVQGAGAGVAGVVVNVVVGHGYPGALRPRMVAVTSSAWVLPSLVTPALAGVVAQSLDWRWVFLGVLPAVGVAAVVALPPIAAVATTTHAHAPAAASAGVPDADRAAPVSAWTALALAAGAGLFLAGLGARQPALAFPLAAVGLAIAAPALRAALPRRGETGRATLLLAFVAGGAANLAFFGAEAFLPLTLTSIHHRVASVAGVVLTSASLSWTAGAWTQARLLPRIGARLVGGIGLALVALGVAGLFVLEAAATAWWEAYPAWALAGAGMGLAYSTVTVVVLGAGAPARRGANAAAMGVVFSLGVAVGTGVGGALLAGSVAGGHGPAPGLRRFDLAALIVGLVGAAACIWLPRRGGIDAGASASTPPDRARLGGEHQAGTADR